MKIDRLIGILMILINKRKVTAKYLADHFDVSVRTIQRDIDTLTLAGIPLYADVGVNGGYQLLEDYKIEKGFLNKSEGEILFSFLQSLEHAAPYSEVKSIYNKFATLNDSTTDKNKLVIKLNFNDGSEVFNKALSDITEARDRQKKLKIRYYNANFQHSTRIICPYSLVMLGSTWYLYGYCELKSDFRLFKVGRVVDSEVMKESFELLPMPDFLPWDIGLDSGREHEHIKLLIDIKRLGNLPDYFTPDNCVIDGDFIKADLYFPIDEWVYSLLMNLTPHIEVLQPPYLREEYLNRLQAAISRHN